MKEILIRSIFGSYALYAKQWYKIKTINPSNPEKASIIANGIISDLLITAICERGEKFLDVGAHIGSVFSSVKRHNRYIDVTAVEADPFKSKKLIKNFPDCNIINFAVGEHDKEMTLYKNDIDPGYNSILKINGNNIVEILVQMRKLDSLFKSNCFDVIKIDIEGAELGALRGGSDLINRSRPLIMFESTNILENELGYSAEKLWEWFYGERYGIFTPDRVAHDAEPLKLDVFLDSHRFPMRSHNYFAVPSERREMFRDRARSILRI